MLISEASEEYIAPLFFLLFFLKILYYSFAPLFFLLKILYYSFSCMYEGIEALLFTFPRTNKGVLRSQEEEDEKEEEEEGEGAVRTETNTKPLSWCLNSPRGDATSLPSDKL